MMRLKLSCAADNGAGEAQQQSELVCGVYPREFNEQIQHESTQHDGGIEAHNLIEQRAGDLTVERAGSVCGSLHRISSCWTRSIAGARYLA